jgi:phospholipid/cholesterol/gamma-HCH transport system ATP-binding protein
MTGEPLIITKGLHFFDEPSSGVDPSSGRLLEGLILKLSASLGTTIVVFSHDLASLFAIGSNPIFLDVDF